MKDDYSIPLQKYNILLEENKQLKTELALLEGEDSLPMPVTENIEHISTSSVNQHSSPEEKITLFRSLFKGR